MKTAAAVRKLKTRVKAQVAKAQAPVTMIEPPTDRERRLEQVDVRPKVLKALSREFDTLDCVWQLILGSPAISVHDFCSHQIPQNIELHKCSIV